MVVQKENLKIYYALLILKKTLVKLNVGLYLLLTLMNSFYLIIIEKYETSIDAKLNYVRAPSSGIKEEYFCRAIYFLVASGLLSRNFYSPA